MIFTLNVMENILENILIICKNLYSIQTVLSTITFAFPKSRIGGKLVHY